MNKITCALCVILLLGSSTSFGQDYTRAFEIPVQENENYLSDPWVGGLSHLQYSTIDLNQDSKMDLFIFDRAGDKVLTYLFDSENDGIPVYKYAPEYESLFPEDLKNWVLLYDYNCDGLKDIFTSESGGIGVYKQEFSNNSISFLNQASPLSSYYGYETDFTASLYNISNDLPAITDIDGDGDTDILSFSPSSSTVHYYINEASDIGRCDTLIMSLGNSCYGDFSESQSTDFIELGSICESNVIDIRQHENSVGSRLVHLGGTLSSQDMNGDGRNELFIGDSTSDKVIMLTNSASTEERDSMTVLASSFPSDLSLDQGIGFYQFPGVYFEDFNDDGITDLASSTFHSFGSQDDESSWLYLNIGQEDAPDYQLISKSWLQEDMIEHGSYSQPVVLDYNGDGKQDLVIGNQNTVLGNDLFYSSLRLYENVGTISVPEFNLIDDDWLNLSESGFFDIHPTFGDIDNDSDIDVIIGENSGKLYLYRNESNDASIISVSEPELILDNTSVGFNFSGNSKPQLVDLNEDGLLDLVVGELFGSLNYCENIGSSEEFSFQLITENLGNISIDGDDFDLRLVPFMFKKDNEWHLIVGSKNGHMQRYVTTNISEEFTRLDQELFSVNDGMFSSPSAFDINADGFEDLFVGNIRGGVSFYFGQFFDGIVESTLESSLLIYPNPVSDKLSIETEGNENLKSFQVISNLGQVVLEGELKGIKSTIETLALPKGLYILKLKTDKSETQQRFIKN